MKVSMQYSTYFWLSCLTILVAVAVNLSEVSEEDVVRFLKSLSFPILDETIPVKEAEFDQMLDHFNRTDYSHKFKQRYFINNKYYDDTQNEPIVLFVVAAMTNITESILQEDNYIEFAKNTNALMLALEPRFYGKSHPFENLSVENLYYLNSEQALADFAYFKEEIPSILETKHNIKVSKKAKWITTGRDYGGSYAAWYKLKFPHETIAAIPLSAPLWVKPSYDEFFDRVERFLHYANYEKLVHNAYETIDSLLRVQGANGSERSWESRKADLDKLKKDLSLCADLYNENEEIKEEENSPRDNGTGEIQQETTGDAQEKDKSESSKKSDKLIYDNINLMFYSMSQHLAIVALGSGSENNRKKALDFLNEANKSDYEKFTNMIRYTVEGFKKGNCLANDYNESLRTYKDTNLANIYEVHEDLRNSLGTRQKLYQHCFEMGMFNSAGGQNFFAQYVPASFCIEICGKVFNPEMTIRSIESAIYTTNLLYGSLKFEGRKTVFINHKGDMYGPNELKYSKPGNELISIVIANIPDDISTVTEEEKKRIRNYYYRIFTPILKWSGITYTLVTDKQLIDYYKDEEGQHENVDNIQQAKYLEHKTEMNEKK